jgi:NAD(P)-dependent dehydrogenase (short-subunit alcohol dehydrogenase family)
VAEVARSHRLSWPTVQRAVTGAVAALPAEPAPTARLGIDETRFGRPRWRQDTDGRWRLDEPWETGFVDLTGAQGLLGQVDGRTSAFGDIDVLVSGAAGNFPAAALDMSPGAFRSVVNIDLLGSRLAQTLVEPVQRGSLLVKRSAPGGGGRERRRRSRSRWRP